MQKIKILVENESCFPKKAHPNDAGFDLIANKILSYIVNGIKVPGPNFYDDKFFIKPFSRVLVGTGVKLELPIGWYAEVVSRSGMTLKRGLIVLNSPGIIDADYRGEIGVILYNSSNQEIFIDKNDRIAQLIFHQLPEIDLQISDDLNLTERGEGGFGSTGK